MKRTYIYIILCSIFALLSGCNDDQQKFFDGETSMHFALTVTELDSMTYSFMNTTENQIIVKLPIELDGYAKKNFDFRLKINTKNTTAVAGKHYQALAEKYQVKEGEYSVEVPVILMYDSELDSVAVKLELELEPIGDLAEGIPYRQKVTIISSNLLPPIPDWENWYRSYFGAYSKVKHRYILSELKLNTFMNFENVLEWYYTPSTQRTAYGWQMNNFFAEHEIYDENGQRIEPWMN